MKNNCYDNEIWLTSRQRINDCRPDVGNAIIFALINSPQVNFLSKGRWKLMLIIHTNYVPAPVPRTIQKYYDVFNKCSALSF